MGRPRHRHTAHMMMMACTARCPVRSPLPSSELTPSTPRIIAHHHGLVGSSTSSTTPTMAQAAAAVAAAAAARPPAAPLRASSAFRAVGGSSSFLASCGRSGQHHLLGVNVSQVPTTGGAAGHSSTVYSKSRDHVRQASVRALSHTDGSGSSHHHRPVLALEVCSACLILCLHTTPPPGTGDDACWLSHP